MGTMFVEKFLFGRNLSIGDFQQLHQFLLQMHHCQSCTASLSNALCILSYSLPALYLYFCVFLGELSGAVLIIAGLVVSLA